MRTPLLSRPKPPADPLAPPRSPYRDRWWWAAAIVVAVIVVLGAIALFGGRHQPAAPAASRPSAAAPTAASSAPSAASSSAPTGCPDLGLPAADQQIPTTGPVVTWSRIGRVSAPSSPTIGPAGPGLGRCYAHTPAGALLAGANFLAWTTDPGNVTTAVQALAAPGAGQDVLLEQLAADPAQVLGSGSPWQLAGFTFLQATGDQAAIAVVVRGSTGGFAAVPLTLTWTQDTWLVVLPVDGNLVAHATPLSTLDGYVPWQAG